MTVKLPDYVIEDRPDFGRESWSTTRFSRLETGDIFQERNHGDAVFVVLSGAVEKTEGYVTPVLSRWVTRAVFDTGRDKPRYHTEPEDFRVHVNASVLVRCDRTYRIWTDPAPGRAEFEPFLDQILDCHCDLCNERGYAASSGAADGGTDGRPYRIANRILLDVLIDGTHVRREHAEWIEICKARHTESVADGGPGCGYHKASMRDFYASGMGLGMTPGGVGGSTRR